MKRRRLSLALACGLACGGPTSPRGLARISVVGDSIAATITHAGSVDLPRFPLSVTLESRSSSTVEFNVCGSVIEGNDGTNWSAVWVPACLLSTTTDSQVDGVNLMALPSNTFVVHGTE